MKKSVFIGYQKQFILERNDFYHYPVELFCREFHTKFLLSINEIKASIHTLHIEFVAVGKHCKGGRLRSECLYLRAVVHEIRREGLEIYFSLVFEDLPYFVVVKRITFELVFQRSIYQSVLSIALKIAKFFKGADIYAQVRVATIGEYRTRNFLLWQVVQLPYLSVESK